MSDYIPSPQIPLDIFRKEIFHRLDLKTLVKCSRVCKQWNSIITSPSFISNQSIRSYHHNLSNNEEELILIQHFHTPTWVWNLSPNIHDEFYMLSSNSIEEEEQGLTRKTHLIRGLKSPPIDRFRSPDFKSSFKVVGTCNGLVCVCDYSFSYFILWNPFLHKYLLLPSLYHDFSSMKVSIGFGFDPTNNDFKLVKFAFSDCPHYMGETWVFSFVSWSWKKLLLNGKKWTPLVPPGKNIIEGQSQLFMDGKIHWIARKNSPSSSNFIIVFDLAQEAFLEIQLPESIINIASISVFKTMGSLAVSHVEQSVVFPPILRVWVMKEYGVAESWTNIVEMQQTPQRIPKKVMFMRKNGEMIIEELGGSVVSLNPWTYERQDLGLQVTHSDFFAGYLGESLNLFQKGYPVLSYM